MVVVVVRRMGGLRKILQESVCPGTWNQRERWSSPVGTHEYPCECVGCSRLLLSWAARLTASHISSTRRTDGRLMVDTRLICTFEILHVVNTLFFFKLISPH